MVTDSELEQLVALAQAGDQSISASVQQILSRYLATQRQ